MVANTSQLVILLRQTLFEPLAAAISGWNDRLPFVNKLDKIRRSRENHGTGDALRKTIILVTLLCLAVSAYGRVQTSNATLGGTVIDATGAFIPGVEITATNSGTGIVTTVISNESGAYQFASLQPGT